MASIVTQVHSSSFVEVPDDVSPSAARTLVDSALNQLISKVHATSPGKEHPAGSRFLVKNLREEIRRSDGGFTVSVSAELHLVTA